MSVRLFSMPKTAYLCDKCLTPYKEEDAAVRCEQRHCAEDQIKLKHLIWRPLGNRTVLDADAWCPDEVAIELPGQPPFNDPLTAIYVRKQIRD